MNLIYYVSPGNKVGPKLRQVVTGAAGDWEIHGCRTLAQLEAALRRLGLRWGVVVLAVEGQGEMELITRLAPLLANWKLILVAPDDERKTIGWSHKLKPRFLTFGDGDFSDVAGVLARLIGKLNWSRPKEAGQG